MKKKAQLKKKTGTGRGPVARKVIASARQHFQEKITHLSDWREAKIQAENFRKTVISKHKLTEYDPLHGVYIYAQNQLSVLIELIIELPMLDKLADVYSEAQEEYMPSGPPMSPLTTSYFTCWGSFDLCFSGAKKETLCTIATDLCRFLKVDEGLTALFEKMQTSRMGIYKHEGSSGKSVFLREMITDETVKAISPGGYLGHTGEMWFARVLPPPFDIQGLDYSVVFTTPYVLGKSGPRKEFIPFVEEDWLAYFIRNFPKTNAKTRELAYEYLMKYGLGRNYWNEYVFLAYRNHQHDMILLEGFPDIPSSLPHTKEGRKKLPPAEPEAYRLSPSKGLFVSR
ncbi:hypothetical protein SAMN05421690_105214 [Nitrosomonas sp. Nm51]|uniref:hypothetical protein n=1 Tax=Nitrosomonas sp. Nm51 TaxID=133720 RepID=UPI0008C4B861|nr:hypothetical protein [Nitrosomonas sp. Nm51]SER67843.1 hypothetical protein SAMN05421690_105214 [Nitrosomonas sp. Nm51]